MNKILRAGDIILFAFPQSGGKYWKIVSYIVTLLTDSKYSHCGIIINQNEMVHATWEGVRKQLIKDVICQYGEYDVGRIIYPDMINKKIAEYAISKVGTKYDKFGIAGILIMKLFKRLNINFLDSYKTLWCSELALEGLIYARYSATNIQDDKTDPGDIPDLSGFQWVYKSAKSRQRS